MKTRKRKFGFTLVEMSVALAVTAIMMIMISTLTITVFDQRATVEKQYNQSNEITEITALMQSWFDEFTVENGKFQILDDENNKRVVAFNFKKDDGSFPSVSAKLNDDGNLVFTTYALSDNDKPKELICYYIKEITFSVPENADDSIVMTIKYDSFDKSELSMRFLYCGKVF